MTVVGIVFLTLLLSGIPVSFAVGLSAFAGAVFLTDVPVMEIFGNMALGLYNPLLLAAPLFILAANLMNAGEATDRLIDLCDCLVGHRRGGLAYVNVAVSMIFAGITGASQADTQSVGKNLIPRMEEQGYSQETAVGVTAASSIIGCVIPPSVSMVVYAAIAGVNLDSLFVSGIFPGLLLGCAMLFAVFCNRKKPGFPRGERKEPEVFKQRITESLPALLTPVILIGGIISGWYTPVEASIFACLYALLIGVFFYGSIKVRDLPRIIMDTTKTTALLLFALATANSMRLLVVYFHLDQNVIHFFTGVEGGRVWFLLSVEAAFLLIGMLIDAVPAIIIFVPVILPAAAELGISPLILGLVTVITLALGLVTPPYGPCLKIAADIGGIRVNRAFCGVRPYLLASVPVLLLLAICPDIFLAVPRVFAPFLF